MLRGIRSGIAGARCDLKSSDLGARTALSSIGGEDINLACTKPKLRQKGAVEMANDAFHFDITVDSHTDEFLQEVEHMLPFMLRSVGEEVEGYAKEDCPVDTGLLHNSITYAVHGESPNITKYSADRPKTAGGEIKRGTYGGAMPQEPDPAQASVYVGSNVKYAEAVEMRDMSHQVGKAHFIRDAFQDHREDIKDIVETAFRALQ